LHWQSRFSIEETMGALEELVDQGKTRALGVSNFDVDDLAQARGALTRHPIACNQVLYHLRDRSAETELLPYCKRHSIALVGYSPFGHGDFPTGRTRQRQALAKVAQHHGATPRQVALAFLTREAGTFAIPKASNLDHVRENAAAGDLRLTAQDIERIDEAFPTPPAGTPLGAL
jgi:diketogulonate reductase-like aldo/keto reductase